MDDEDNEDDDAECYCGDNDEMDYCRLEAAFIDATIMSITQSMYSSAFARLAKRLVLVWSSLLWARSNAHREMCRRPTDCHAWQRCLCLQLVRLQTVLRARQLLAQRVMVVEVRWWQMVGVVRVAWIRLRIGLAIVLTRERRRRALVLGRSRKRRLREHRRVGCDVATGFVPDLVGQLAVVLVDHDIALNLASASIATADVFLALSTLVAVVAVSGDCAGHSADQNAASETALASGAVIGGIQLLWNVLGREWLRHWEYKTRHQTMEYGLMQG
jgi:hypothetical protein